MELFKGFGKNGKSEKDNTEVGNKNSKTNEAIAKEVKLCNKAFQNPDDLCDFVNESGIQPASINTADRFYIVFYYA